MTGFPPGFCFLTRHEDVEDSAEIREITILCRGSACPLLECRTSIERRPTHTLRPHVPRGSLLPSDHHMKIAQVNKYLYPKGGADVYCLRLAKLLRQKGHDLVLMGMEPPEDEEVEFPAYTVPRIDYDAELSRREQLRTAAGFIYSRRAARTMARLIRRERPDLVHFQNVYHQLSPSVILTAWSMGVPTVMTLHDYKITCTVYSHFRNGTVCEECRGGRFYNTVRWRCARGSLLKSLLGAAEMCLHRGLLKSYQKLDARIAPSRFLQRKVRELGFPAGIQHVPNFVEIDDYTPRYDWQDRQIVYVGRLSREKGLPTLLTAVQGLDVHLRVIGRGPLEDALHRQANANGLDNVTFEGYQSGERLRRMVAASMFTVVPSEWYENNPLVIHESFALGKPVVGANIGGIPELIGRGRGICYRAGDREALRDAIVELAGDERRIKEMGRSARRFAEERLSPEAHYEALMNIYRQITTAN